MLKMFAIDFYYIRALTIDYYHVKYVSIDFYYIRALTIDHYHVKYVCYWLLLY